MLKALQDNSSKDGNQQATKELSPDEKNLSELFGIEDIAQVWKVYVAVWFKTLSSTICLRTLRNVYLKTVVVEEYIFLPLNASPADKEAFYEGLNVQPVL